MCVKVIKTPYELVQELEMLSKPQEFEPYFTNYVQKQELVCYKV